MMKNYKTLKNFLHISVVICVLLLSILPIIAQENQEQEEQVQEKKEITEKKVFPLYLSVNIGPQLQYNAAPLPSTATPINFSAGFGLKVDFLEYLSFWPHININRLYYLLQDECARPASPENRLCYVPQLIIDLPVCFCYPVNKSYLTIGAGIALFLRYAFPEKKLTDSEKADVAKINSYFYKNGRFIYPSFHMAWDFKLTEDSECGLFAKVFFPIGNSADTYSVIQDTIVTIGARANFKMKKSPTN